MRSKAKAAPKWGRLGWVTLLVFTLKGITSTALIVWAALAATPWR